MSRFDCADWECERPPEMWERTVQNAIRGKRGQKVLRELREALLAMPEPRLIKGAVACDGEVCAIGALAAHRLSAGPVAVKVPWRSEQTLTSLPELEEFADDLDGDYGTVEFGKSLGLTGALAWAIAWENDEMWGCRLETPEQCYRRVLHWVEGQIANGARS